MFLRRVLVACCFMAALAMPVYGFASLSENHPPGSVAVTSTFGQSVAPPMNQMVLVAADKSSTSREASFSLTSSSSPPIPQLGIQDEIAFTTSKKQQLRATASNTPSNESPPNRQTVENQAADGSSSPAHIQQQQKANGPPTVFAADASGFTEEHLLL